jgi:hypothetical protein
MTKCRRPRNCFRYFVLFSLFGSTWKHSDTDCFRYLEAFGSIRILTVFAIWKHSNTDCFRCLEAFGYWLFSLFGSIRILTVFAIWKHLEAFGYWLFSLFGSIRILTVFAIWTKHSNTDCFRCLEAFGYWLFSLFCTVLTLNGRISENSKTSRWFRK